MNDQLTLPPSYYSFVADHGWIKITINWRPQKIQYSRGEAGSWTGWPSDQLRRPGRRGSKMPMTKRMMQRSVPPSMSIRVLEENAMQQMGKLDNLIRCLRLGRSCKDLWSVVCFRTGSRHSHGMMATCCLWAQLSTRCPWHLEHDLQCRWIRSQVFWSSSIPCRRLLQQPAQDLCCRTRRSWK